MVVERPNPGHRGVHPTGRAALRCVLLGGLSVLLMAALPIEAQVPRGSSASLDRQNDQARNHDFSYLRNATEVRRFVDSGYLVPIRPTRDFDVHNVSFPYARPEVKVFIERLATQYRSACGEKLVVTSLTRPLSNQPSNASTRSVHPTGMAIDLRRPANSRCRSWLESTLASLTSRGVIEAIHERNPPHYHVAVFPRPYVAYVASMTGQTRVAANVGEENAQLRADVEVHRVQRGETLTGIASSYGTTVGWIQSENGLRGSTIRAGQELKVPVYRAVAVNQVAEVGAGESTASESSLDAGGAGPVIEQSASAGHTSPPTTVHRVGRGESLWTIARRYGVTETDLRRANGIAGSRILVGQEIVVPGEGAFTGAQLLEHRVARGESLWTIARRYGTTVEEIRERNRMDSTRILAGQVIEVPVGR